MKQVGILTLVSVIASAAAPVAPAAHDGVELATPKSVAQFGGCFVASQQRADLPWSYVPKADGGTFSNVGAKRAGNVYFLAVSDRGAVREIRLEAGGPGAPVNAGEARVVNRCA